MTSTRALEETTFISATSVEPAAMPLSALKLLSSATLWLSLSTAYGQTVSDSAMTTSGRAPYKFAVGARVATFGDDEISLSGKYFLSPKSALHLTVGRVRGGSESPSIAGFYERYRPLFRSEGLRYFYGVGLNAFFPKIQGETKLRNAITYAGATLGVDYAFKVFPLNFGVDFRQMFGLGQHTATLAESHNLAVSAHYRFK